MTPVVQSLGIAPGENPRSEPVDVVNNACWLRIHDFCMLARYYRPFLFCFDQTEDYPQTWNCSNSLDESWFDMVNEVPNHLTVVTANQRFGIPKFSRNIEYRSSRSFFNFEATPWPGSSRRRRIDRVTAYPFRACRRASSTIPGPKMA